MRSINDFYGFIQAQATAERIVRALPKEIWREQPEGEFGPGEILVHTTQSEQFAVSFILPAVGIGDPFQLVEPFKSLVALPDPVERHKRLSELNLQGARNRLIKFESLGELQEWWLVKRREAEERLKAIPYDCWDSLIIHHPLVSLSESCDMMCHTLFVGHLYYHFGQLTALMKRYGYADRVPFPFGTFI